MFALLATRAGAVAMLTGWVTPLPSTSSFVMLAIPWTVMTLLEALPAVPRLGWSAAVAAPAGSGRDAAETGRAVPLAIPCTESTSEAELPAVPKAGCFAAVLAPAGKGRDAAETGCVTPEPSVFTGVMLAMPWTLITSLAEAPAVPKAGCFALVEAPLGSGSDAAEIGWVAW
jgi:hypothetical protein